MAEVPPTNHRFTISHAEADQLWKFGRPTDDSLELVQLGEPYIRSKRSENGLWHIKQFPIDEMVSLRERAETSFPDLDPQRLCELNDAEHERFKALGLSIVSFARVPLNHKRNIFTISPYMEDMEEIGIKDYYLHVDPILRTYYQEWLNVFATGTRPFHMVDADQFSSAPGVDHFFLHDTDPFTGESLEVVTLMNEVEASIRDAGLLD